MYRNLERPPDGPSPRTGDRSPYGRIKPRSDRDARPSGGRRPDSLAYPWPGRKIASAGATFIMRNVIVLTAMAMTRLRTCPPSCSLWKSVEAGSKLSVFLVSQPDWDGTGNLALITLLVVRAATSSVDRPPLRPQGTQVASNRRVASTKCV